MAPWAPGLRHHACHKCHGMFQVSKRGGEGGTKAYLIRYDSGMHNSRGPAFGNRPPSSFLLHPSSFILPPSSFLLPPSSILLPQGPSAHVLHTHIYISTYPHIHISTYLHMFALRCHPLSPYVTTDGQRMLKLVSLPPYATPSPHMSLLVGSAC